ncbi:molybdate ABC transporter substrate-binding protein [Roseobacter sp. S98]|uniref:molybdate ABC transporter substrate-binding protein n=1 Tax=Roseobacter algicola (ex Choi et al. 2025) (nom. illeg.) TaxID=3092138 RepID=UPI0035C781C1
MSSSFPKLLISLMCSLVLTSAPARAEQITVFAAASLRTALVEIAAGFEEESGHSVAFSFAGSSVLARQISLGAPADVYVSANTAWMDYLEQQGRINATTRFDLAGNKLVLIAANPDVPPVELSAQTDLAGLIGDGRLAVALVDAVPAGLYAKEALSYFGLWQSVATRTAQTDNVRASLALVATGAAPYGIVYATDALADARVKAVAVFPAESHQPIVYPAAAVASEPSGAARGFLDYLRSPQTDKVLTRLGFAAGTE